MTKAEYREYFAQCKPYIKFNYFIKECNISQSSFSKFMKDPLFDYVLSINSLDKVYSMIKDCVNKIV